MSQGRDFFPQSTGKKEKRAKEKQVSLNNQFPTDLEEGKDSWIAVADIV